MAARARSSRSAFEGPDVLVIAAKPGYNSTWPTSAARAEAQAKIEQALQRLLHRPVTVRYERRPPEVERRPMRGTAEARRPDALATDPMIQKVVELFEARPVQLEYDDDDPTPT